MEKEYYFISDLHIGENYFDNNCEFEDELIKFLDKLRNSKRNIELIIVGDMLGLWLLHDIPEWKKAEYIISKHKKLFSAFKKAGEKIKITAVPGNHDHEIISNKKNIEILAKYNINFQKKAHITRKIGKKTIWIEHGHRHDTFSAISDFGNKHAKTPSYYITKEVMKSLKKTRKINGKKHKWMNNIKYVQPRESLVSWFFSNYFYRELNPFFRYSLLPFLLLFGFSSIVLVASIFKKFNLLTIPFLTQEFGTHFGIFGNILDLIIYLDIYLIIILLVIALPFMLFSRDISKTFKKFGITTEQLKSVKHEKYIEAAREVLKKNNHTAFFVFGHDHNAFMKKVDEGCIINTGTWLKLMTRIKPHKLFLLPSVYSVSYSLSAMHIYRKFDKIIAEHDIIPKSTKNSFTFLENIAILFKRKQLSYKKRIRKLIVDNE